MNLISKIKMIKKTALIVFIIVYAVDVLVAVRDAAAKIGFILLK
jgi:hypothetical protein